MIFYAAEQTSDHIIVTDAGGCFEYVNRAFERQTGFKLSELHGKTPRVLKSGRHPASFYRDLWDRLAAGETFRGMFINRKKNGEIYHEEKTITPIRDASSRIRWYLSTGRDVSARLRAQQELERREHFFRTLIDSSTDLIAVLGPDRRSRFYNSSLYDLLGYSAEDRLGRSATDLVHPDDRESVLELLERSRMQPHVRVSGEARLRRADGEWRWFRGSVHNLCDDPAIGGIVVTARDVTESKKTLLEELRLRKALENAASEWMSTFDAIAHPIVVVNRTSHVLRANRATREAAGVGFDELIGRPLDDVGRGEPWKSAARLARDLDDSGSQAPVHVGDPQTGRTWEISLHRVQPQTQQASWAIIGLRDVTGRVELEASLRRAERIAAMGSLVAGVAHEVRNPLFGISATLDALEARFGEREELAAFVEVLRGEVNRLRRLMGDLLDYGRPIDGETAPIELVEIVREAIRACVPLSEKSGIEVVNGLEGKLHCMGSRGRLEQVFRNLIENAIQHAPHHSRVAVRCRRDVSNGGMIRCTVEDAGPGFRTEELELALNPFYSRRPGGTGLGLSIAQRIVEEHGGHITLQNRPGGGASVSVVLPAVKGAGAS